MRGRFRGGHLPARNTWLAIASALATAGLLLSCGGAAELSQDLANRDRSRLAGSIEPSRLNIVLVTIDTLRADRLSPYGATTVDTPAFDRLASRSVRFANASSTVPFTLPAHASIMTGTYPPYHGVRENVGYYLASSTPTLAELLESSGRETAGFVSAFVLDARWGIGRGFNHYHDEFDLGAFEHANLGSVQRPGEETIAAATAWLDEREGDATRSQQPFFLWLHLYDPHDPYTPPEPFRSAHPGRPYDAEVSYTDSMLGGFLDDLESRGLLESSVIAVTSDHGEGLGDHGEAFHGYFVYDSTIHVPLFIRAPGLVVGSVATEAVSHVDLLPTILDLAGLDVPPHAQGRSLMPAIVGREPELSDADPPVSYAESFYPLYHYGWAPLRALRSESFKYIEAPEAELFDLAQDPGEESNLYQSHPETGRPMARALRSLAEQIGEGAAAQDQAPDLDEQTLAQLRALGYLAGRGEKGADYDPSIPRADPKHKVELHRLIMRAQSRVSGGEEAEAAELLQQALAEDPELLDAHQLLGNVALHLADPDEAAGHFERALALDDQHKPSLFGLATAHQRLGRDQDALLGFQRLLDIAGQDSKATLAVADIRMKQSELELARAALEAATTPGAPAILFNRLGEIEALGGQTAKAQENFELAIEGNPELSQPHFNLAVLAEGSGDLVGARGEYELAIQKAPRHYQAQFNLARLHGRLGHPDRELELLEGAVASKPDFALGHFFLGKALMDRDLDLERAETVTRAGLDLTEDNPLGWFVLADILNRKQRPVEAREALRRGQALQ